MSQSPSSTDLLALRDLRAGFDTEEGWRLAVDGISLALQPGRSLGLVGESGCGKSVTALSIMRLLPQPHGHVVGGSIAFEGQDLATLPQAELASLRGGAMSMIFQEPMTALHPVRSIGDQLLEALRLHDRQGSAQAHEARVLEMLQRVGIAGGRDRLRQYPHQLSGGMRQRVMIAMSLLNRPRLLIADEPTTALDETVQAQILELIADLQREMGMGVLLITHDLGVVAQYCDEVAVMYAGRIVERASVQQLFAKPRHAYTRALLASRPRLEGKPKTLLPAIAGQVPSLRDWVSGCRFAPRSGLAHEPAWTQQPLAVVEIEPGHWVEHCPACLS